MLQASYSFPSEILPALELGLAVLAALLVLWRPRRLEGPLRTAWRALRRWRSRRAIFASAVFALLASLASFAILGPPVAHVPDEFGYLLLADTFAHGRLANPQPRVPAAFEAPPHVLVYPHYASKYAPAQGAFLAVGERLGNPAIGISLAVAFLAACCWFLAGWLPPPWPLVLAGVLTLRLGVASYWGQSYWGGALAAAGAMLMLGALPRFRPKGRHAVAREPWVPLALGVLVLANSRYLEGLVAALPAAVAIVAFAGRRALAKPQRLVLPLALLVAGVAVIGGYNRAVTGDALVLPHQLYRTTYGYDEPIPFVAPPAPVS